MAGGLEIIYGIGALVLLGALIYGFSQWRSRNRDLKPLTEAATRENYAREERKRAAQEAPDNERN